MLCGTKEMQRRADAAVLRDTLETERGGMGPGDEECVPQKQKTSSRACCLGFTETFAWRKTCIPVACAFLHLSHSISLLCLEGGIRLHRRGLEQF